MAWPETSSARGSEAFRTGVFGGLWRTMADFLHASSSLSWESSADWEPVLRRWSGSLLFSGVKFVTRDACLCQDPQLCACSLPPCLPLFLFPLPHLFYPFSEFHSVTFSPRSLSRTTYILKMLSKKFPQKTKIYFTSSILWLQRTLGELYFLRLR